MDLDRWAMDSATGREEGSSYASAELNLLVILVREGSQAKPRVASPSVGTWVPCSHRWGRCLGSCATEHILPRSPALWVGALLGPVGCAISTTR